MIFDFLFLLRINAKIFIKNKKLYFFALITGIVFYACSQYTGREAVKPKQESVYKIASSHAEILVTDSLLINYFNLTVLVNSQLSAIFANMSSSEINNYYQTTDDIYEVFLEDTTNSSLRELMASRLGFNSYGEYVSYSISASNARNYLIAGYSGFVGMTESQIDDIIATTMRERAFLIGFEPAPGMGSSRTDGYADCMEGVLNALLTCESRANKHSNRLFQLWQCEVASWKGQNECCDSFPAECEGDN